MDFVTEVKEMQEVVVKTEYKPCNITLHDDDGDYVCIRINGFSIFNIYPNGKFSRIGAVPSYTGLDVDEYGKIKENK